MTKKSQATRLKLLQNLEAYVCGEAPSPLEMMRAARMENWATIIKRRGKEFVLVVTGNVSRHPEIDDGTPISTPAVMWFDRKARFCRTANRLFVLGLPDGCDIPINEEGDV